ncbi:MAG: DUF6046 domain-containing protein [Dysgonamonadaceae bacterium]|jgi:hypothetical protein|nr:DUF6046 domain-containing protein [Dysgonamonadaceae bacterium]
MAIYFNFVPGFNLPPYWLNHPIAIPGKENGEFDNPSEYLGNLYQDSVRIKWDDESEWWTLPLDPVVSITGKNIIVRRNVLKVDNTIENRRGSIKEIWSQDDYEINIAGVLIGDSDLPENDLRQLRKYCESRKVILVESKLFSIFKITQLAVEDYSLPFTKGIENQMYTIKAYSDDMFDLLVKEETR